MYHRDEEGGLQPLALDFVDERPTPLSDEFVLDRLAEILRNGGPSRPRPGPAAVSGEVALLATVLQDAIHVLRLKVIA